MERIIQKLRADLFKEKQVEVFVMRDDLPDPVLSGNKARKLKYNLEKAREEKHDTLLTFGGAYSNHIAAVAAGGMQNGFKTIGIIRGEENSNITLSRAAKHGMLLHFVNREFYRKKNSAEMNKYLEEKFGRFYLIPEGGANEEGFKGCCEIVNDISTDFDYIICPCGTGTTLAGIASALKPHQQAIGISVLKNNYSIEEAVKKFHGNESHETRWQVMHDYHFGGYAKTSEDLDLFIKDFTSLTAIPTEPVYTGKMFFALYDLAGKGFFSQKSKIVVVHTGGMQYLIST